MSEEQRLTALTMRREMVKGVGQAFLVRAATPARRKQELPSGSWLCMELSKETALYWPHHDNVLAYGSCNIALCTCRLRSYRRAVSNSFVDCAHRDFQTKDFEAGEERDNE